MTSTASTAHPARTDAPATLVHRPVRAYPRPLPEVDLTLAAPPTVGLAPSGLTGWLQFLVPLVGSGESVAFLFAVPGPRPAWLVALVVAAAAASVLAGLALRMVERRTTRRARRQERARYLDHLARSAIRADQLAATQLATTEHLHPDPAGLWSAVIRTDRLWERRPADADFLTVRIGRGPVPLAAPVRLESARDPLVVPDPELLLAAERLVGRATWLPDAPVSIPLRQLGVVAVTGPPDLTRALTRAVVCELVAFHAPDDLQILAAYPPAARPSWQWMRWLPHARDPTLTPDRALAVGPSPGMGPGPGCLLAESQAQLDAHLARELRARTASSPDDGPLAGRPAGPGLAGDRPHLVVIIDTTAPPGDADPPLGEHPAAPTRRTFQGTAVDELLEHPAAAGITVIWLARAVSGEPSELSMRIRLDDHGAATVQETIPGGRVRGGIRADAAGVARCEAVARHLAPLELDRRSSAAAGKGPVRLLDLLGPRDRSGDRSGRLGGGHAVA